MASPRDIEVSREYSKAKQRWEISQKRIQRAISTTFRDHFAIRRPVGSSRVHDRRVRVVRTTPDLHLKTMMSLHINCFADYIRAHTAYYRDNRSVSNTVLTKALNLAVGAQQLGLPQADHDLKAFVQSVSLLRVQAATRACLRNKRTEMQMKRAGQPHEKYPRHLVVALTQALEEAQFLMVDSSKVREGQSIVNEWFSPH